MNGQVRKMVALQAQAAGSAGSGVVAIRGEADNSGLSVTSLTLQASGQTIDVPTLRGGGGARRDGGGGGSDAGVIDVDVI
jgi:hypothetical protein